MAKKKTLTKLGHLQLAVLRSLWRRNSATVNQVHADLYAALSLAPTTVGTILRRMEVRGLVKHTEEGRQFFYQPLVSEDEVAQSAAEDVLDHLFEGRLSEMVTCLFQKRRISGKELDELAVLIAAKRKQVKDR